MPPLATMMRRFLAKPAAPPPASPEGPEPVDPRMVGLTDAARSGWYQMDRRELFEGFPISPEDVVLDVGCGRGDHAYICATWGAHVIFTDVDPSSVALTAKRLAELPARAFTPIVSDADPLPLEDGTATRIISTEVLEHVDDPRRVLAEFARVGKSRALYLLTVPDPVQEELQHDLAPASFFQKPAPGQGMIRGLSSGHLRTIGRDEFEQLVQEAGLVVEQHRYAGFFWALWFAFFWSTGVDFSAPAHPVLDNWARTWKALLDTPDGLRVKRTLDAFMPKSQIIIARKP